MLAIVYDNFKDYLLFRFKTGEAKYSSSGDSVRPSVFPESKITMISQCGQLYQNIAFS